MDQFIKYAVPVDKELIKWEHIDMCYGGSQLLEILEKEFQYEELILSGSRLGINSSQLERLQLWVKHNCNVVEMAEKNKMRQDVSRSFFFRGAGILAILYKSLDLSPVIQNDQILSRFSFIRYNLIKNEIGSLVISEIVKEKWSSKEPSSYEQSFMTQHFFYDTDMNRLQPESKIARDLLDMHIITQIMTGDGQK